MLELRQTNLSVFYFLKDRLDSNGWGSVGYHDGDRVELVMGYPGEVDNRNIVTPDIAIDKDSEVVLPVVVVEDVNQREYPIGLGERPGTIRPYLITVLGENEPEAQEIAQSIFNWLRDEDIPVNNYNAGFPPQVVPTQVATMQIDGLSQTPVRIAGAPNVADRHRREITFNGIVHGVPTFS